MARADRRLARRKRIGLTVVSVALVAAGTTFYFATNHSSAEAGVVAKDVTTTTVPAEQPEAGWTVVATGARGVYSDKKQVNVGTIPFLAARFWSATTKLSWHPGTEDPPHAATLLPGYTSKIDFAGAEGAEGVLGVFNSAFKLESHAGGLKVSQSVLAPFKPGYATLGLDANGNVALWAGAAYQAPTGFNGEIFRQNLPLLVLDGQVTPLSKNSSPSVWGDTIGGALRVARSGIGLDSRGNVIYVGTMAKCIPSELAQAMVAAGVVKGMQLDINPYWPILGMAATPLHQPLGFPTVLPNSEHSPHVYVDGWTRDFFVVTARR